ncbi:MAG: TolC family protein [Desulfobacteraceae bacterium]|nr:TolC family protein [Desulfobacteraceae bacterium]
MPALPLRLPSIRIFLPRRIRFLQSVQKSDKRSKVTYPQISASTGYDRYSSASSGRLTGSSDADQYSAGVNLSQMIYDFGKTRTQTDIQSLNLNASQSDLANTQDQIIFNVRQSYFGRIAGIEKTKTVATETVGQFQKHLDSAKGFYKVGTKPKFDVTKAEVDLSNARLNLIKADNALRLAIANLNNAMGVPDAPEYGIEDNLEFHKKDISFEEALETAYRSRPDLEALKIRKKSAEDSIRLAQKGFYPVVSGNAGYSWTDSSFPPSENSWNVGASVTFPIFSGYSTTYQVEEAKANLNVIASNEEALRQSVFLDVQQAYLSLKEAEERIPATALTVKQAKENLDIADGRYATGVGNPIEVTDAQIAYTNAKNNYTQALYDYQIAYSKLEKAAGLK